MPRPCLTTAPMLTTLGPGAIYAMNSEVTVMGSRFTNNSASDGGGCQQVVDDGGRFFQCRRLRRAMPTRMNQPVRWDIRREADATPLATMKRPFFICIPRTVGGECGILVPPDVGSDERMRPANSDGRDDLLSSRGQEDVGEATYR